MSCSICHLDMTQKLNFVLKKNRGRLKNQLLPRAWPAVVEALYCDGFLMAEQKAIIPGHVCLHLPTTLSWASPAFTQLGSFFSVLSNT